MKEVVIVSAKRTPMGSFQGMFANVPAPKLGATAIQAAIQEAGINAEQVDEVYFGNVLQAGVGQAPARQAAMAAGIPNTVPATTINKVCSSGLKSVMLAAQSIALGDTDVVVAGGMESMSNVPYYLTSARNGYRLGDNKVVDGLVNDGLTDVYNAQHMGSCSELCAEKYDLSREDQDNYAIESYNRASKAWEENKFSREIAPVSVPQRRGDDVVIDHDEEYKNVKMEKIPTLRTVFKKDGTITAANASTLNDGASALVLMSREKADELGLKPLAKVIASADAAHEPEWFTTAPAKAVKKLVDKAGIAIEDVDMFELNEAFSVVALANMKELGIDGSKCNIYGGAVSLGHPLGSSGSRILCTLISALHDTKGKLGVAGLCNGGGGASSILIEAIH